MSHFCPVLCVPGPRATRGPSVLTGCRGNIPQLLHLRLWAEVLMEKSCEVSIIFMDVTAVLQVKDKVSRQPNSRINLILHMLTIT